MTEIPMVSLDPVPPIAALALTKMSKKGTHGWKTLALTAWTDEKLAVTMSWSMRMLGGAQPASSS